MRHALRGPAHLHRGVHRHSRLRMGAGRSAMGFRCRGRGGAHAFVLLCVLLHGRSLRRVRSRRIGREVMTMALKGLHRERPCKGFGRKGVGLTIAVATAVPLAVIVALALGCYVGLNSTGVVAVSVVFTLLFTLYAVTVHALCLEYRKSGLGN